MYHNGCLSGHNNTEKEMETTLTYEGDLHQNWQLSHHHLFRYREWANGSRFGGNQRGKSNITATS